MNILHIITGLNDGGAEAVLYRLCRNDKAHRHQVVSLMDAGKYGALLKKEGVPVSCLGMHRGRLTLGGLSRLWRLLRGDKWDVVQTWMYHADLVGGLVARLAGVDRVFWGIRHTTLEPGKSRRATMLVARLNARLSRWVPTGIVCCAERARAVHSALGYFDEKMKVIPNGYDLDLFRPNAVVRQRLRAEWGVDETVPLIGMVGRFDPLKDHGNLIQALFALNQMGIAYRCVMVGSGMDASTAQLATWLDRYGLRGAVLLLGPQDNIPEIMNALDIHVLSSCGEAFPNVLAEAMACGTPCVTTDVGDAALIVGDAGWVVPPQNPELLAQSLSIALEEWQDREAWAIRQFTARQRIGGRFSITQMVNSYHSVWETSAAYDNA